MHKAEQIGIHGEQWGCRKTRTSTDPALRKMMAFEFGRYTNATIALFANDQTACFDRLFPSLTNVVLGSYGIEPSVTKCRSQTVDQMQRRCKTGLGISEDHYCNTEGDPMIAGEIQGKADTGCAWTLTSGYLLTAYDMKHPPMRLPDVSGDTTLGITKANDAFVDDVDSWAALMQYGDDVS